MTLPEINYRDGKDYSEDQREYRGFTIERDLHYKSLLKPKDPTTGEFPLGSFASIAQMQRAIDRHLDNPKPKITEMTKDEYERLRKDNLQEQSKG